MRLDAYVPYGGYWSTPFVKWQGALASQHPLKLAAACAQTALAARTIDPRALTSMVLGFTVPSKHSFYGAPWVATMLGAPGITGPTIMQACATSARCIATAASQVAGDEVVLTLAADKCSNGPHLYYPEPNGPGGKGEPEEWVWDNFNFDPVPKNAMVQTAENVAREAKIDRQAQDALTVRRYAQYADALKDNAAFHRRFMLLPLEVKDGAGKKVIATVTGDDGVFPTNAEGLAKLKPVLPEGTVTFGSQTHPADGNAGMIITTKDKAKALSRQPHVTIRLVSFAQANARKGYMAEAVVPASQKALELAGFKAKDVRIKTHNPFAVNDVLLARQLEVNADTMNNFGSSLVYGHPQGPTGLRGVIELIEELVLAGGGRGLFSGCAAGDTAAAVCLQVDCA
ncbi:MAG: thiolase family protein [Deltaproteobacteria bacterium]|nr:thiolase family protein [Deltaproteobacteria bacterium]